MEKGKFVKSSIELEQMSETNKQAILDDIEAVKQRMMEEVAIRAKEHKKRRAKEQARQQAAYEAQTEKATEEAEAKREKKAGEMRKWLQMKEDEIKRKKLREDAMVGELRAKETEKQDNLKKMEELRLEQRERRIEAARQKNAQMEEEMQTQKAMRREGRAAATASHHSGKGSGSMDILSRSMDDAPNSISLPPSLSMSDKVLHRHIHHHVHYHEGGDVGSKLNDNDTRNFEQASENRVREQLESAEEPGDVDNFAKTPSMRKAQSVSQIPYAGGMNRTQESFKRVESLPQLTPAGSRGLGGYQKGLVRAQDSYSNSMRPCYVNRGRSGAWPR